MYTFKDIIGQNQILNVLRSAVKNDKIGHAYSFSGPKGIGKKTLAGAFAQYVLCEDPIKIETGDACGACRSCFMVQENNHPELKIINAPGSSIGVDSIRMLQEDVTIRPLYGKRKVYIIEEGDLMTAEAQNALLKTLEEPPGYAVIVMTTSNYRKLLATIRSRTLKIDFARYSNEEMETYLQAFPEKSIQDKKLVIAYSEGIIGSAAEMLQSNGFKELRDEVIGIADGILKLNLTYVFDKIKILQNNKDNIQKILDIMETWYRDLALMHKLGEDSILINSDKKDMIVNSAAVTAYEKVANAVQVVEKTRRYLQQNANYDLAVETMLLKIQEEN